MNDDTGPAAGPHGDQQPVTYRPPAITYLGNLAELTHQKAVGGADGTTFLGVDLGSL